MTALTAAHVWVLDRIGGGQPSVVDLAAATGLTPGHVALCLADLRERGDLPPASKGHQQLTSVSAR